jgi:hypothetical protein
MPTADTRRLSCDYVKELSRQARVTTRPWEIRYRCLDNNDENKSQLGLINIRLVQIHTYRKCHQQHGHHPLGGRSLLLR